jgi:hypothetical protein
MIAHNIQILALSDGYLIAVAQLSSPNRRVVRRYSSLGDLKQDLEIITKPGMRIEGIMEELRLNSVVDVKAIKLSGQAITYFSSLRPNAAGDRI